MDSSHGRPWFRAALLLGLAYLVIGRVFALPSGHARAWRLAAWLVSGAVFAAHIAYEHFRLRNPPRSTALHAATGVAIGALGLAIVGMLHSMPTAAAVRGRWLLALILWPAFTAVPAFLVALIAAAVLSRVPRSSADRT